MCLFEREMPNKKYIKNKKNGGIIPPFFDERQLTVKIGCGNCIECRKKKGREWQVRLMEEIKHSKNGHFVTLTFSNESIKKLLEMKANKNYKSLEGLSGYDIDNGIAKRATRLFLERWRKKYGKSLRHWFVTELGHAGTENIHMHGIVWTDNIHELKDIWGYGFVWDGYNTLGKRINYVNEKTVNYLIKYISKLDKKHEYYKSRILCSPGIGKDYVDNNNRNKFNGKNTDLSYITRTGHKLNLPPYYKRKLYTDEERERLWRDCLDKGIIYVMNEECKDANEAEKLRQWYRKINAKLGYKGYTVNEDELEEEKKFRNQLYKIRKGPGAAPLPPAP